MASKISSKQLDLNDFHFSDDDRELNLAPDAVDYSIYGMKWIDLTVSASSFSFVSGNSEYALSDEAILDAKIIGDSELYRNGVSIKRVAGTPAATDEWKLEADKIIVYGDITASGDTYRICYQTLTSGSTPAQVYEGKHTYILERVLAGNVSGGTAASRLTVGGNAPDGSNTAIMPNNSTYGVKALVVGRRTDVDGEGAFFELFAAFERNANAASTSMVGSQMKIIIANDNDGDWDANLVANTTDGGFHVEVSQANSSGKTVKWKTSVEIVKIAE